MGQMKNLSMDSLTPGDPNFKMGWYGIKGGYIFLDHITLDHPTLMVKIGFRGSHGSLDKLTNEPHTRSIITGDSFGNVWGTIDLPLQLWVSEAKFISESIDHFVVQNSGSQTIELDDDKTEEIDLEKIEDEATDMVKTEHEKQKDFFFPKNDPHGWGSCECGLDAAGAGGNHSSWCPKARHNG